MPNRSYIRGSNFERSVIHQLENIGWSAIRSAGSKKMFDVIAWNSDSLKFIQCKTTLKAPTIKMYLSDLRAISDVSVPSNSSKELWVKYGRKTTRILVV